MKNYSEGYYVIESVSDEGKYYLVNGWNRYKTFWTTNRGWALFKSPVQAKASLTKLLKVMDDYESDTFYMLKIVAKTVVEKTLIERDAK